MSKPARTFMFNNEMYKVPDWVTDVRAYRQVFCALPPFFTRMTAAKCLGGLISISSLAHYDRRGEGPESSLVRGKTIYFRDTLVPDCRQFHQQLL